MKIARWRRGSVVWLAPTTLIVRRPLSRQHALISDLSNRSPNSGPGTGMPPSIPTYPGPSTNVVGMGDSMGSRSGNAFVHFDASRTHRVPHSWPYRPSVRASSATPSELDAQPRTRGFSNPLVGFEKFLRMGDQVGNFCLPDSLVLIGGWTTCEGRLFRPPLPSSRGRRERWKGERGLSCEAVRLPEERGPRPLHDGDDRRP